MTFIKVAGIFSATFLALTLSSCSRGFSAANQPTLAAPQQLQAVQVVYVAQRQTISTYTVNSSDGSMDQGALRITTVPLPRSLKGDDGSYLGLPQL
jgi:hypothetical protein